MRLEVLEQREFVISKKRNCTEERTTAESRAGKSPVTAARISPTISQLSSVSARILSARLPNVDSFGATTNFCLMEIVFSSIIN